MCKAKEKKYLILKILNTNDKSQHKNNLDESLNQSCDNISFEKSKPFVNIVEKKKKRKKTKECRKYRSY